MKQIYPALFQSYGEQNTPQWRVYLLVLLFFNVTNSISISPADDPATRDISIQTSPA